jgi:hypothetical protein
MRTAARHLLATICCFVLCGFGASAQAQGLDRSKREGGVLGVYLFFDNPTRTVTTIYFLNQEPPKRFKTMEEYAAIRDRFLSNYTSCIRDSLRPGSETK